MNTITYSIINNDNNDNNIEYFNINDINNKYNNNIINNDLNNDNNNNNSDNNNSDNNNDINADKILNEYNLLKKLLIKYKDDFINLEEQKNNFNKYNFSLLKNHSDIINICYINIRYEENPEDNDIRKATELFIDYNNKMKEIYNNWLNNYYVPTIEKLSNNIDDLELKINNFRKLFIMTINEITKTNEITNKKLCPICFDNEVDMTAIPCGHTFCNNCIITSGTYYTNIKKCLTCRNPSEKYIKIFFMI